MPSPVAPLLAALLAIGACTTFPELEAAEAGKAGAAPALLPMDQILGAAGAPPAGDPAGGALSGRAAGLKARADALRGG